MFSCFRFRAASVLIFFLVALNVTYISIYLLGSTSTTSNLVRMSWSESDASHLCSPVSSVSGGKNVQNRISIDFNIMDIYRIDTSCEYITHALGSRLSTRYANKPMIKRCSFSSFSDHTPRSQAQVYEPITNVTTKLAINSLANNESKYNDTMKTTTYNEFDPFDPINNEKGDFALLEEFKELQIGGEWTPKGLRNPCNVDNIDHVVFIVPFTRSRLDNLKLFLINMHAFLQKVSNPFK